MKKLFTLLMILAVATVGYSQVKSMSKKNNFGPVAKERIALRNEGNDAMQNVMIQPNMMRSNGELDYSTYDWQSNDGPRTWTHLWEDGTVNFAYTCATDNGFTTRGTGIGTYTPDDEWIPLGGRIEAEKTGFGSIAQYGEKGLVVAAHTATECGVYIIEDKDNMAPETAITMDKLDNTYEPCWPNVMTSGPNRDIIHVIATASAGYVDGYEEATDPMIYFRSTDGGQTWDKENVVLPFMTPEYAIDWTSNCCHWMETTEDNCLALVVNNAWSDGMVIYSYDDGETWDRIVYYKHPGPEADFTDTWFFYPRWVAAEWDMAHKLHIAYEFMATTGEPGSSSYYPSVGGVAYWSENLPYHGCDTCPYPYGNDHVAGEPFVMDSVYTYEDIYASWAFFSDRTHAMWPEYLGPLVPLDDQQQPQDPENNWDQIEEFNIDSDGRSLHGAYNCGICAMPVLCRVPGSNDLVAVWSMMDEHHTDDNGNFLFKLYTRYSADGGLTWTPMRAITTQTMHSRLEMVYTQAVIKDHTLIIATQADKCAGTFVQSDDDDATDNYYQGFTIDLDDFFGPFITGGVSVPEINNTQMTICPNPAVDNLTVTLSNNAEIVIYNIMGQVVSTVKGHAGLNDIDVSSLSSGVYFINAGSDTQKFVVK